MATPDSWEDMDDTPAPPARQTLPNNNSNMPPNYRLNATAHTFSFNPGAVTFTPNYGASPGYYAPPNMQYEYGQPSYVAPQAYAAYPQAYGGYPAGYMSPAQGQVPQQPQQAAHGYNNPRGRNQYNQSNQPSQQQRFDGQYRSPRPAGSQGNGIRPQQQYRPAGSRPTLSQTPQAQVQAQGHVQSQAQGQAQVQAQARTQVQAHAQIQAPAASKTKESGTEAVPVASTSVVPSPSSIEKPRPAESSSAVASVSQESASSNNLHEEENEDANMDVEPQQKEAPVSDAAEQAAASQNPVPDVMDIAEKVSSLDIQDTKVLKPSDTMEDDSHEKVREERPSKVEEAMEEEEEESVTDVIEDDDPRDHLNLVFIGHVDAGKSTIGGQILYLSEMVDKRTIEKFEREAKDKNRESWYMAYIMDTNEEERAKGKTVEVGRAHFETAKRRYTILDAPGHKNYVPNMISGASQADVGVLVIAARKGEFETGFERGGQTREHAQLAKTLGVSKLVVVVNKMDDPSVHWDKERFDEIVTKMTPFLKGCGYNTKKDVQFLPISGLMGINMKERMSQEVCPWWDGPAFFETLDALALPERDPKGLFRMPLIDKYRDMGTVVMGKIESGSVRRGDSLLVMPNKVQVKAVTIFRDNDEVKYAKPGENLRIRISGIEEEDILPGFVLSSVKKPIVAVVEFDATLQILELLDHKAIFTAGYKAILHIHSVVEECEIIDLIQQMDPKTKKMMKRKPLFVKSNAIVTARIQVSQLICVEAFEAFPQLGRFTLRDEGKTVAIGKVSCLITHSGE